MKKTLVTLSIIMMAMLFGTQTTFAACQCQQMIKRAHHACPLTRHYVSPACPIGCPLTDPSPCRKMIAPCPCVSPACPITFPCPCQQAAPCPCVSPACPITCPAPCCPCPAAPCPCQPSCDCCD